MFVFLIGIVVAALVGVGASLFDHRVVRRCHRGTLTCWSAYTLFAFGALVWSGFFFTVLN